MIEEISLLLEKKEKRAQLVALRQLVKNEDIKEELHKVEKESGVIQSCLQDEDAKTRKNAALLLGELEEQESVPLLFQEYQRESVRFVKSAYLKAMKKLDVSEFLEPLKERLEELKAYKPLEEEKKHINEEKKELLELLLKDEKPSHEFCGENGKFSMLLMTDKAFQESVLYQLGKGEHKIVPAGVFVKQGQLHKILNIRGYKEMLFLLKNVKKVEAKPENIGKMLKNSDLLELLTKNHKGEAPFYFRVEIRGKALGDERNKLTKRIAQEIEEAFDHQLMNSKSHYEFEIRLAINQEDLTLPVIKLHTIEDERFAYREKFVAASLQPYKAAGMMELIRPYIEKNAVVLDPFCGAATMLIERDKLCATKEMYAVDTFKDAIEAGKHNSKLAKVGINFIQRDFFDFTHRHEFDEILTDLPARNRNTREEQNTFYEKFFERGINLLKDQGMMFLYSDEEGIVKKQIRLREELKLVQCYSIGNKERFHFFIIKVRKY